MIAPDGTRFPWVLAPDYRWHRRPADATWEARVLEKGCRTACGLVVKPLYVATAPPRGLSTTCKETACCTS